VASNLRTRPLYALAAILTVWTAAQFWLCRHAILGAQAIAQQHMLHLELARPDLTFHVANVPTSLWVRAGLESVAGVLLPTIVTLLLVAGGRRWLAASVAAYPFANILGGFHQDVALGVGWQQPYAALNWSAYGTILDTTLLLVVAALLVSAVPRAAERTPIRWGFARVVPVLVVMTGWWVTRHPAPQAHDWVWLGDALLFVLVAAVLADSALPVAVRAAAIGLVLPLSTGTVLNDLIAPHRIGFPAVYFLHHMVIALGTALYVAGVPAAVSRLRGIGAAAPATA
jgi:hypothetical protein